MYHHAFPADCGCCQKLLPLVDKEGNPVYSETPPEAGVNAEVRQFTPAKAPPAQEKAEDDNGNKSAYEKKNQAEVAELVQKNCDAARSNLSIFQNPKTVLIKNSDGSFDKVTDEMREEQSKKAEEQIKEFCKKPGK